MLIIWTFFSFWLGVSLGSFANVLIDRMQRDESLLGNSHCENCNYQLCWFDNIPILSFFILKGCCRQCQSRISWQYPLVEALFGFIFLITFWQWLLIGNGWVDLVFYFVITFIFLVILVWDFKYMIIPNFLVSSGLLVTISYLIYNGFINKNLISWQGDLIGSLFGGLIVGGFFALMFYGSKGRWIGGGDVKLGFWLGFLVGVKWTYLFLMLSYVTGAIYSIFLVIFGKKGMKSQVPFGPFLIIAGYLILFFGEKLLYFYKGLF